MEWGKGQSMVSRRETRAVRAKGQGGLMKAGGGSRRSFERKPQAVPLLGCTYSEEEGASGPVQPPDGRSARLGPGQSSESPPCEGLIQLPALIFGVRS